MKTLILVSSSNAFLERNVNLLKRTDFRIVTAATGAETLRLHDQDRAQLILSELNLADMGGDELCKRVRQATSQENTAFILTCLDSPEELSRAAGSGANAWITKPIQPLVLLNLIGQYLTFPMIRSIRVRLEVSVQTSREGATFSCISRNVSTTGILLETARELAVGDRIVCRFALPGLQQIEAEGDVVRSVRMLAGGHQYGVRFTGLFSESRRMIERYISHFTMELQPAYA